MTFLKADGSVKNRTGWRDGWPIKKNGEPNMKPRRRRWGHYKKGTTAYRRMMSRRMREVLARKNGMPKPAAPTHDGLNGWTFVNVDSRKVVFIDMSNHVLVSGPSK